MPRQSASLKAYTVGITRGPDIKEWRGAEEGLYREGEIHSCCKVSPSQNRSPKKDTENSGTAVPCGLWERHAILALQTLNTAL